MSNRVVLVVLLLCVFLLLCFLCFYCYYVFIDVRLSHLNKDYLLTYLLKPLLVSVVSGATGPRGHCVCRTKHALTPSRSVLSVLHQNGWWTPRRNVAISSPSLARYSATCHYRVREITLEFSRGNYHSYRGSTYSSLARHSSSRRRHHSHRRNYQDSVDEWVPPSYGVWTGAVADQVYRKRKSPTDVLKIVFLLFGPHQC